MKQIMHRDRKLVWAVLLALAAALPGAAAAQVATLSTGPSSLSWNPVIDHDGLVLTVSGGGHWLRSEFGPGESASFATVDGEGNALPDGVYTWELRAQPQRLGLNREEFENESSSDGGNVVTFSRAPRIPTQSGSFRIVNGSIVDPNALEGAGGGGFVRGGAGTSTSTSGLSRDGATTSASGPVALDQVILDDLIVDGSACIGFDCVNGESFGFDTVRLKENNLRIKFDDTSTSASFPRNDWQITANDSANGGAEKFSIDDISGGRTPFTIEASAPSHSLYVDDGGRIGLGTSTPVVELHVIDGDTPTLRLEQDGSSGFTPQTWDVAGNETNFFVRDATNGSTLPFRIRPGAPSSSVFVDTDGSVGFGTASPAFPAHVKATSSNIGAGNAALLLENNSGTNDVAFQLRDASSTGDFWNISYVTADNQFRVSRAGTGAIELIVEANGDLRALGNFISGGTTLNVPDYVFEPDYQLMPLDELEAFIRERRHLPNVPSAEEVRKSDGVNLSELQMKLLEKVEELTLYTLAQEQRIEQLTALVHELRGESETQERRE